MRSVALLVLVVVAGCKDGSAENRRRAEENLRRLAHYEKELLKVADGGGFQAVKSFPSGEPWQTPSAAVPSVPVQLVTNASGLLEERYEVVVDSEGRNKPIVGTIGAGGAKVSEGKGSPGWFEARAIGRFGEGGSLGCLRLRIEVVTEDLLKPSKLVESMGPCPEQQGR